MHFDLVDLRVWANTTAMREFLRPVLKTCLKQHPDVNVDLIERLNHDFVRSVGESTIDSDIGIVSGSERTEALQVIPYRSDLLVFVAPRGHAFAGSPTRSRSTRSACTKAARCAPF